MPTTAVPRRKKPKTPLDRSAAPAAVEEREERPPPPDLEELSPGLVKLREKAFAQCMGQRLSGWLAHHGVMLPASYTIWHNSVKPRRCSPVDVAYFLPLLVEAMLKAFILFPDLIPTAPEEEEDEAPGGRPVVGRYLAHEAGLHQERKRPGKHKPVPTLPGCPGVEGVCENLRRVGSRYCPEHEKVVRERMRGEG